jgi:hypothetical protein
VTKLLNSRFAFVLLGASLASGVIPSMRMNILMKALTRLEPTARRSR